MDESEVVDGDWRGVSFGEPAAVEGAESTFFETAVLFRTGFWGRAVEAIAELYFVDNSEGVTRVISFN